MDFIFCLALLTSIILLISLFNGNFDFYDGLSYFFVSVAITLVLAVPLCNREYESKEFVVYEMEGSQYSVIDGSLINLNSSFNMSFKEKTVRIKYLPKNNIWILSSPIWLDEEPSPEILEDK